MASGSNGRTWELHSRFVFQRRFPHRDSAGGTQAALISAGYLSIMISQFSWKAFVGICFLCITPFTIRSLPRRRVESLVASLYIR